MLRVSDQTVRHGTGSTNTTGATSAASLTAPQHRQQQQLSANNLTEAEKLVVFLAESYLLFSVVDRDTLWMLLSPHVTRVSSKTVTTSAIEFAKKHMTKVLSAHKGHSAHVTLEIGTIRDRYVGICLHFNGEPPLVLRLVDDRSLVNKTYVHPRRMFGSGVKEVHELDEGPEEEEEEENFLDEEVSAEDLSADAVALTDAVVEEFLITHLEYLLERDIVVTSVTSRARGNNSSDMLISKARKSLTYSAGQPHQIRCACLVFELVVEAMLEDDAAYGKVFRCMRSFADGFHSEKGLSSVQLEGKPNKGLQFPSLKKGTDAAYGFVSAFIDHTTNSPQFAQEWSRYRAAKGVEADTDTLEKLHKILHRFLIAMKMCQGDGANMLTLLAALEVIHDDLESVSKLSENMSLAVENAYDCLISRPLTVAAYFCPVYNLMDITPHEPESQAKFQHLASLVTHAWMFSRIMMAAHELQGLGPVRFESPADIFGWESDAMTPISIVRHWKKHDRIIKDDVRVHKYFLPLVEVRPSGAEVKRLVRRAKLTASACSRTSLHPRTAETHLHVNNIMSSVYGRNDDSSAPTVVETLPLANSASLAKDVALCSEGGGLVTKRVVLSVLMRARTMYCCAFEGKEDKRLSCLICDEVVTEEEKALDFVIKCLVCRRSAHTLCANRVTNKNLWACKECYN